MNKDEIVEQTRLAFDYIQKLYFEVSYLIKEMEGLLAEEEPAFILLRPSGYQIINRSSNGLEPYNVNLWLMRKFAVAFGLEESTPIKRGQTITKLEPDIKVIYLRIILNDIDNPEPMIYSGVLHNFEKKTPLKSWPTKFEQLLTTFEYQETRVFSDPSSINYEDKSVCFNGRLFNTPLYDINSSEVLYKKLIQPSIKLYNQI